MRCAQRFSGLAQSREPRRIGGAKRAGYEKDMNPEQVAQLIRAGLPGADVRVESDDNTHFAARIVTPEFAGKRSLARHLRERRQV